MRNAKSGGMMMTGRRFRYAERVAGLTLVMLVAGLCLPSLAVAEKIEYAFPDDPGVVQEPGMMQIINKFRDSMGWGQNTINRDDGSTLIVVSGIGTISAPRESSAFVGSRQNAFDKAMLQAKKKLVELQEVQISGELESHYSEPSEKRQQQEIERKRREGLAIEAAGEAAEAKQESGSDADSVAAAASMQLVRNEVDKRLRELGYDPSKPVDEQKLRKVTQQESFKKVVEATAKARVVGLQPFKIFENYNDGEQGQIGVVAVWSPKLSATAKAIYSGDPSSLPRNEQSNPSFSEQVPSDPRVLLSTFGVRQVIGPDGEYGVLSFAQSAPRNDNRRSLNAAVKKATLNARFYIRQFAGEVASVETAQRNSETATSFANGMESYEYDESYQETIRTKAEAINISGTRVIKQWSGSHPISGNPVAGVVMLWTPSGAEAAGSIEREMNRSSSNASGDGGTTQDDSPYEGEYDGSSDAADTDAF